MLKACKYCGKIHDSKLNCGKKPVYKKRTKESKYRSTGEWTRKAIEIKQRDTYLCQVCIRELYNTINKYNHSNLSVHHAVPLKQNKSKSDDNNNLITLCAYHHELAESGQIPLKIVLDIIQEQEKGKEYPPYCL